jgi:hypothetical protein
MSMYFYASDCMRALAGGTAANKAVQASWPRPSLGELRADADAFCRMPWTDVLKVLFFPFPPTYRE